MDRFVLNIINYTSGFDMTGFRHVLTVEAEREDWLNYSSKPVTIEWYSASSSPLREMELHSKIVQAYKTQGGRDPSQIEVIACKRHMDRQEKEAESAYPQGWYPSWVAANQEAERLMAEKINQIRREKGYTV